MATRGEWRRRRRRETFSLYNALVATVANLNFDQLIIFLFSEGRIDGLGSHEPNILRKGSQKIFLILLRLLGGEENQLSILGDVGNLHVRLRIITKRVHRTARLTANLRKPEFVMLLELKTLELFSLDDAIAEKAERLQANSSTPEHLHLIQRGDALLLA